MDAQLGAVGIASARGPSVYVDTASSSEVRRAGVRCHWRTPFGEPGIWGVMVGEVRRAVLRCDWRGDACARRCRADEAWRAGAIAVHPDVEGNPSVV